MKTLKAVIDFTESAEFANALLKSTDSSPLEILKLHSKIVTLVNCAKLVCSHVDMVAWDYDRDELNEKLDIRFSDLYASCTTDENWEREYNVEQSILLRESIQNLFPEFDK